MPEATGATTGRFMTWVDKQGKEELLSASSDLYSSPRISPDGKLLALSILKGGKSSIWIWDIARESFAPLTHEGYLDTSPIWTPDSKRIVFASNRSGNYGVYWTAADGTGQSEQHNLGPGMNYWPRCWSADGNTLALMRGTSTYDIGMTLARGDRRWQPLLAGKTNEILPRVSPDGRWLAYVSNESGEYEVYVRPFPDVNKWRSKVSGNGGNSPLWSPDSRNLFYLNRDSVMSVSVTANPEFSPETPRTLFSGKYVSLDFNDFSNAFEPWDISPDGKRFLMLKSQSAGESKEMRINIVLNWFEELKQRVPAK